MKRRAPMMEDEDRNSSEACRGERRPPHTALHSKQPAEASGVLRTRRSTANGLQSVHHFCVDPKSHRRGNTSVTWFKK
ncbi:hypothetical protein FQA47_006107 [Oryzias melastigma]|uniref:Uncharacterized protein n=1 Tax=Oryzias melastigma TaxID=30732 RepID=A0A834C0H5_ORYME|nr:hypothetical protein FQA47_006107 [Oryzias melastigma]